MKSLFNARTAFAIGLVVLGVVFRFMPHPPAFSPIMSIALFGGAFLGKRTAYLVPLVAMLISDLFLGLHESMWAVYLCFAAMVFAGQSFLKNPTVAKVGLSSLASAILFFVVTNFSVWALTSMYTKDLAGLTLCYEMAIPFFRNNVAGTLVYSTVLFGAYKFAERFVPSFSTNA